MEVCEECRVEDVALVDQFEFLLDQGVAEEASHLGDVESLLMPPLCKLNCIYTLTQFFILKAKILIFYAVAEYKWNSLIIDKIGSKLCFHITCI